MNFCHLINSKKISLTFENSLKFKFQISGLPFSILFCCNNNVKIQKKNQDYNIQWWLDIFSKYYSLFFSSLKAFKPASTLCWLLEFYFLLENILKNLKPVVCMHQIFSSKLWLKKSIYPESRNINNGLSNLN